MKTLVAHSAESDGSAVTRHSWVPKVLLTCGILSSLLYAASTILGAMRWEGYNFISHAVSELSAIDAPSRPVMVLLGLLYSLLIIAFGLGVWASADGKRSLRVVAVLLIGYGVACLTAPLTPIHQRGVVWILTDTLHMIFTVVDVLLILLIIVFGARAFGKRFRTYSIGTILVGAISGILMGLDTPRLGIWERINILSFLLWMAMLAIALLNVHADSRYRKDW